MSGQFPSGATSDWRRRVVCAAAGAVCLWAGDAAMAQVNAFWDGTKKLGFQFDILDMYQHQDRGLDHDANWERGGGWCRPTAYMDALYGWEKAGFNTLEDDITKNDKWLGAATPALKDLSNNYWFGGTKTSPWGKNPLEEYLHNRPGGSVGVAAGARKGLMEVEIIDDRSGRLKYTSWALNSDGSRKNVPGAGGTGTILSAASDSFIKNRSVILTLRTGGQAGATAQGLWWGGGTEAGNYHAVTMAGLDQTNSKIWFADPDSNKGNAQSDAGITGGFRPPGIGVPAGSRIPAKDPIVEAKRFAATDPIPVAARIPGQPSAVPTGVPAYYREVTMDADGRNFLFDNVNNERYRWPYIAAYNTVETVKTAAKALPPAPPAPGGPVAPSASGILNIFEVSAGMVEPVDEFWMFPNAPIDFGSLSFSAPGGSWVLDQALLPGMPDPWGNDWLYGGFSFRLDGGSPLMPESSLGELRFNSLSAVTAWDTYYRDASDPTRQWWDVQSVGADFIGYVPNVPEPAGVVVVAAMTGLLMRRRRG